MIRILPFLFLVACGGPVKINQPAPAPNKVSAALIESSESDPIPFYSNQTKEMQSAEGKLVLVTGTISHFITSKDKEITFIVFTGNSREDFGVVALGDVQDALRKAFGSNLNLALAKHKVSIFGTLTLYNNRPEIKLSTPEQIKVLKE